MDRCEVAFTREWLSRLSAAMEKDDVLVGGQALAFWSVHFGLLGPGDSGFTKDADILGGFGTVAAIAMAVNGKAAYPPSHGFGTALYGLVEIGVGPSEFLNVDILRTVIGLDPARVRRRAVPVSFAFSPDNTFAVMHPVDVFVSKLANLSIKGKQTDEGTWQALLAVRMAKAYLANLAERNPDAAAKAVNEVFRFGKSGNGLRALALGVDPFDALDGLRIDNQNFNDFGWPRMKKAIGDIRADIRQNPDPDADEEGGGFRPI